MFLSVAQRKYMHKNHPEIAAEWEKVSTGKLPQYVPGSLHEPMAMLKRGMQGMKA